MSIRNLSAAIILRIAFARSGRCSRRSRSSSVRWRRRNTSRWLKRARKALVVYQETYNRGVYAEMHTSGPKRDFNWRLDCPERAYAAGFRRIGIGALFGLSPWRAEATALAAHLEYLQKRCWQSDLTVSLPRLRPAAGEFVPPFSLGDRELAQLICAFRICFPRVGIVLSTREPAPLRDALASLGVTAMSSGSHTEPGGYTGQGRGEVHQTVRGRIQPPDATSDEIATSQFEISDDRSPWRSRMFCAAAGLNRSGKIGTRRSPADERFSSTAKPVDCGGRLKRSRR